MLQRPRAILEQKANGRVTSLLRAHAALEGQEGQSGIWGCGPLPAAPRSTRPKGQARPMWWRCPVPILKFFLTFEQQIPHFHLHWAPRITELVLLGSHKVWDLLPVHGRTQ